MDALLPAATLALKQIAVKLFRVSETELFSQVYSIGETAEEHKMQPGVFLFKEDQSVNANFRLEQNRG